MDVINHSNGTKIGPEPIRFLIQVIKWRNERFINVQSNICFFLRKPLSERLNPPWKERKTGGNLVTWEREKVDRVFAAVHRHLYTDWWPYSWFFLWSCVIKSCLNWTNMMQGKNWLSKKGFYTIPILLELGTRVTQRHCPKSSRVQNV